MMESLRDDYIRSPKANIAIIHSSFARFFD